MEKSETMSEQHETTIEFNEDRDAYVLDCTCADQTERELTSYKAAFNAGYDHWEDVVRDQ
jgi:hypothetical protein